MTDVSIVNPPGLGTVANSSRKLAIQSLETGVTRPQTHLILEKPNFDSSQKNGTRSGNSPVKTTMILATSGENQSLCSNSPSQLVSEWLNIGQIKEIFLAIEENGAHP